jgi:hypothetical protein
MSELRTWKCDGCGALKKDVNHWWMLQRFIEGAINVLVLPWDEKAAAESAASQHTKHACGRECAHKLLDQWMNEIAADQKGATA